jgi:hypothetical protein
VGLIPFSSEDSTMAIKTWLKSCVSESCHFEPYAGHSLKEALIISGCNGSLQEDIFIQGYDKWNSSFVLANRRETWTNAQLGFHVLSSELIQHPRFDNYYKSKSVPDSIFDAWVDYVEHFKVVEVFDEKVLSSHYEMKRVIKYFKVDKQKNSILFEEIDSIDFSPARDVRIERDEFYSVIENQTHQFLSERKAEIQEIDTDYGGDFDSGWALGRLSKYSKPEYKTADSNMGPITGYISSQIPVTFQEFKEASSS